MSYEDLVRAAKGEISLDLLIRNAKIVNVHTREIYDANIGILGNRIAFVGEAEAFESQRIFDAKGMYAVPGLIDSHLHIESSMIIPPRFAEAVLPHGTTTVAVDPHEICNVLGTRGVRLMLESSTNLPLKVLVLAPTCVPAVKGADTAGAEIFAKDIREMLTWERVIGLAEVMDYSGVINLDKRMTEIVKVGGEANVIIDGHCMSLSSKQLNAYVCTGIEANHEFFPNVENGFEEILREIRLGLFAKLRKKALTSDTVKSLAHIPDRESILFVTDDVMADDLARSGHLDEVIRTAIRNGYDPVEAVQSATIHPARHLRLFDRGSISPGKLADISLLDNLDTFQVNTVFADGKLVSQNGKLRIGLPIFTFPLEAKRTVNLQRPDKESFKIRVPKKDGRVMVRTITMQPSLLTCFETREVEVKDHVIQPDTCTIAVLERHNRHGSKTVGLIDKLGLKEGAIASTVAHDSHNVIVVGRNVDDMAVAVNSLIDCQGGLVAVRNGDVLARLELPVCGLMSEENVESVSAKLLAFRKAEEELGVMDYGTILTISTLALPVIAHARITDKGLFDVDRQQIVSLLVD